MKTRLLIIIGLVFSGGFAVVTPPVSAQCLVNDDWPESPCHDSFVNDSFDQDQVNKWTEYYSYKGSEFMEQKKTEMQTAINDKRLLEWVEESSQNENIWHYYYFSGRAPNAYYYSADFEIITVSENTEFNFEIWPTESIVRHDDFPTVEFTLSPIPSSTFESFYIEEIDESVPDGRILVVYTITDPEGVSQTTIGHFHLDDITQGFTKISFGTPIGGEYSISGTISWQTNGELFTIPSNSITITSIEPIFRGLVEKISINKPWNNIRPLDWSPDGKSILITYNVLRDDDSGFPQLATMSPDGINVITLDIPILFDNDNRIYLAKFSPDGQFIHFGTDDNNLFRYDLKTSQVLQLTQHENGIHDFDYYQYYDDDLNKYSIVVLVDRDYDDLSENGFVLLNIGTGEEPNSIDNAHALVYSFEGNTFDMSSDGKKILFKKTIDAGYGWADRILAYYPAQGDVVEIPNNQVSCGSPPKWSPNGGMIIYSVSSCGRGAPGGTLHLISVDGTYREVLLPYTNNNPGDFAVSPDGDYIIYGVGNDFEIMTLAQPIPEFQTITMMILAASIIPIILARNKLILR